MVLSARAGRHEKHDALVEINGPHGPGESGDPADHRADSVTVIINSPVRDLFSADQDRAVNRILSELDVSAGDVDVYDRYALDFVLRARVRAAVERLRGKGGEYEKLDVLSRGLSREDGQCRHLRSRRAGAGPGGCRR